MSKPVNTKRQPVGFTLEQINYLEGVFPEITMKGQSYADSQFQAGQREVLRHIKSISNTRSRFYVISDAVPQ